MSDGCSDKRRSTKLNVLPENGERDEHSGGALLGRFPSWLHKTLPKTAQFNQTDSVIHKHRLHTVCEEARCPNRFECWSRGTATFLMMGKACTRNCGFCDIDFSKNPQALDPGEPERIVQSIQDLKLKHVVLTMVARDDLDDGGASHLVETIELARQRLPQVTIEVLTSDFNGNWDAIEQVNQAKPDIFNHNIETVEALTSRVRHKATYARTLEMLTYLAKNRSFSEMKIKSGLMVGLGESEAQVFATLNDLKQAGVDIVTIGQYLQPNHRKLLVKEFITPEQFAKYEQYGREILIPFVYAGPFVRSSYNADAIFELMSRHK